MTSDKQLQQNVVDELKWNPSVNSAEIGVASKDGVVTLSGNVTSYSLRLVAERAAERVTGVKGIANELEVKIPGDSIRDDADIVAAALHALKWHTLVPEDKIKVKVTKGWITLDGELEWNYQKQCAVSAVEHLLGVKGVTNMFTLKASVKPTEVKKNIRAAFLRNAEIDANSIQVDTTDSKVTLHGQVRSFSGKRAAEAAAWGAPGVHVVENDLIVSLS